MARTLGAPRRARRTPLASVGKSMRRYAVYDGNECGAGERVGAAAEAAELDGGRVLAEERGSRAGVGVVRLAQRVLDIASGADAEAAGSTV